MSFKDTEIGKIPIGWQISELGEVADVLSGYAFKGKDFVDYGIPVIKIKNIVPPYVSIDDVQYVSEQIFNASKKYQLKYNDILISMTGSNYNQMSSAVGKVGKIRLKNTPMLLNQRVGKIIPNERLCNKEFIYYNISTMETRYRLALSAGGSANQANISPKQIKILKLPIPPIEEQKAIAHILSTLDEKIEINNQIIKTLENMAQAIFKHWFVDFEFPNEDGGPYKSSGGEMVESELGMIPKGWEVKRIIELDLYTSDYVANGSFKSLKENVTLLEDDGYAVFMRNTDLKNNFNSGMKYVDKHSYEFLSKSKLYGNEVIISNVADVGSVHLCPDLEMPMTLGNNIIMLKSEKDSRLNYYFYRLFKSEYGQYLLGTITSGSAQLKFNKTDFRNLKNAFPSDDILLKYLDIENSIENLIHKNNREIRKLSNLRDTLLPKLMSGEIRVPCLPEGAGKPYDEGRFTCP